MMPQKRLHSWDRQSRQVQAAVQAVKAVIDKSWIPEEYRGTSYFGNYDLWEYFELGASTSECEFCKQYSGKTFTGAQLRQVFPDLEIIGEDDIYPNVHMTLWGKDTCKCQLIRVNTGVVKPETLVVYTSERTPYYKKGEYVYEKRKK